MENISLMTGAEMFARRDAIGAEVAALIGRFVFAYSRLNSALHYCVAWHNDGANLEIYSERAEGLSVAGLIKQIETQAKARYGHNSLAFQRYSAWASRAHAAREFRNLIMHSRWGIEPYGRYAIAVSTPPFVQPISERIISASQLETARATCDSLANELGALRHAFPQ
jgi:lysophospholipase L1-like esterase